MLAVTSILFENVLPGTHERGPQQSREKERGDGLIELAMAGHLSSVMSSVGRWRRDWRCHLLRWQRCYLWQGFSLEVPILLFVLDQRSSLCKVCSLLDFVHRASMISLRH